MFYKRTFSIFFSCIFFTLFSSGNLLNDDKRVSKTLSVSEISMLLDNEDNTQLVNKLTHTASQEEAHQLVEASILHLINSEKNWVCNIYDERSQNLAALLGFCAGLTVEIENETGLKKIYLSLKDFLNTLDEVRPGCSKIFSKHVNENNFVLEPINALVTFLYFYLQKVNKCCEDQETKLSNISEAFAYFMNEDEENLWEISTIVLDDLYISHPL